MPVAGQPGIYLLIEDDLGILMAAPAQGHEEKPGFDLLSGAQIHQCRPGTKIDLGRLARHKIQVHRRLGRIEIEGANETVDRGVTATEGVLAHQCLVDGFALDPLLSPARHGIAIRLNRRLGERPRPWGAKGLHQYRIVRQGTARIQPAPAHRDRP